MMVTGNSPHIVELPSEAGLRAAGDIAALLREAISANRAVTIAADTVESADLTTIQLLLSAKKLADREGKFLALATPPHGALRALLVELGFLDTSGAALTEDGAFWASTTPSKGKAQ